MRQGLVLDNCEHLLEASAAFLDRLLSVPGRLHVLATSRQPLGLDAERTLAIAPLAVPDQPGPTRLETLDQYEAITLFVDRARAVVAGFRVTDDNCALVVRLCLLLDGLPLAIELAASRLRAYSLDQLVTLIGDRFALLNTGNRSGPARQQTLRALIDWSFELCTEPERMLWSRLSVFSGGFELAAAETVCAGAGLDAADIAAVLGELIDKSIVIRTEWDSCSRYRMLETVQRYGHDRLVEAGRRAELGRRHRDWVLRLVAEADQGWAGPNQVDWYKRMRVESANLQTALNFCLREKGDGKAALEFVTVVCMHRRASSSFGENRRWLDLVLRRVLEPSSARAKGLWVNGWIALLQGDTTTARRLLDECRTVAGAIGDEEAMAYAIQYSGLADLFEGDPAGAIIRLADARERHLRLDLGEHSRLAALQLVMARCFAGDPSANAAVEDIRGYVSGPPTSVVHAYLSWFEAVIEVVSGDPRLAVTPAADALRIGADVGERWLQSLCLETIAWSVAVQGDHLRAARLLGAAETAWTEIGTRLSGLAHLYPHHERAVRAARQGLGHKRFEHAFRIGAALAQGQAVLLGLGELSAADGAPTNGVAAGAADSALTRREREVACLVARGMSDKDIATELVIAQRTAETHVGRILTKLGFTSRSQIAAWAAEHTPWLRGE